MESKKLIYNNKKTVGNNISKLIKREGYTKLSFAKKTGISRLDLNKILEGDVPSETAFKNHINKIMEILDIGVEELIKNGYDEDKQNDLNIFYHDDVAQDYQRNDSVNEKLDLLEGILDLCEIYI